MRAIVKLKSKKHTQHLDKENIMGLFDGLFSKDKKEQIQSSKSVSFPDGVVHLVDDDFEEFITTYRVCFIDFWSPTCLPCCTMTPRMRRLADHYKGRVAVGSVNIAKNRALAKKYKIMGVPRFILFIFGKNTTGTSGVQSLGELKKLIDKYL